MEENSVGIGAIVFWVLSGVGGIILLSWATTFFMVVQQKTAKIVEIFGKFHSVKSAGLNIKPPFPFGNVVATVNLQIRELKVEVTVKSSDNAFLNVPVKVQYQVIEDKVKEAHYELENPQEQIKSYVVNVVRSKATSMTMDELFKSKDAFQQAVGESLNERFSSYGHKMVNILVDDPQPSNELRQAFDKVLAAEREKDAAQNIADAIRIKMIGEAQAEGESLKIKANAFKEFRLTIAKGNSEAINEFLNGTQGLDAKDVLEFFAGVDTRDAIRDASKGPGSVVVVPMGSNNSDIGNIIAMLKALTPKSPGEEAVK
jgi:regulator of protease activity HflC (stomatin/prohibitin superfamily)